MVWVRHEARHPGGVMTLEPCPICGGRLERTRRMRSQSYIVCTGCPWFILDDEEENAIVTEEGGWIYQPRHKHVCTPPRDLRGIFARAVWRCGECGQDWEVYVHGAEKKLRKIRREKVEERVAKNGD